MNQFFAFTVSIKSIFRTEELQSNWESTHYDEVP